MQTGIAVGTNRITGTLKHVTGYTGFSSNVDEQEGNYIALKFEPVPDDTTVTVELVGGTVGHPVTLDSDMNIVIRITNKDTQTIKVVTTKTGYIGVTKTYSLTGLVCNAS